VGPIKTLLTGHISGHDNWLVLNGTNKKTKLGGHEPQNNNHCHSSNRITRGPGPPSMPPPPSCFMALMMAMVMMHVMGFGHPDGLFLQ